MMQVQQHSTTQYSIIYTQDSVKRHKVQSLLPIICFWLPTAVNKLPIYIEGFQRFSNQITKYITNCLIWPDINVTTSCLKFLYCVQIEKCYMSSSLLQLSSLSFTPTHSFCLSAALVAGIEHQTTSGLRGTQGEIARLPSHSLNFLAMYCKATK